MPYQVFVRSCRSARMNKVRLLSMDFDGTLIRDWAPPPFPVELVHALNRLREQGASIAVNTGRSIYLVEQGLRYTGCPISHSRPNEKSSAGPIQDGRTLASGTRGVSRTMEFSTRKLSACFSRSKHMSNT